MSDYLFENRNKSGNLTFKKWLEDTLRTMPYQKMAHHFSAAAAIEKYVSDLDKAILICKKKRATITKLEKVCAEFKIIDKVNIIIMIYVYLYY